MAYHQLKMYVPGAPEPQIQPSPTTATATITNLYLPYTRGELETNIDKEIFNNNKALAHWEGRTFNTTMSPVYDILHVFTQPVAGSATPLTFVVRPAGLTMVLGSCVI